MDRDPRFVKDDSPSQFKSPLSDFARPRKSTCCFIVPPFALLELQYFLNKALDFNSPAAQSILNNIQGHPTIGGNPTFWLCDPLSGLFCPKAPARKCPARP
jgi:hypothetical protein